MTANEEPAPGCAANASELYARLQKIADGTRTFSRLVTTDAKIAQTPKDVIWTLNKTKLYRYVPVVPEAKRHKLPLILVFAIMNRPHVLDLRPGHSFVEYMLKHGYDLYLLDWGAPGPEDRNLTFDDYTLEYLPRAIRKLKSVSGSDRFNMLGWCLGALISTLYAALRPDDGLKNLVLLTAPLDFTDKTAGGFARWTSDQAFSAEKIVQTFGNVPGELIDYGAKALKPVENFIGSYLNLWDNIDNPKVVQAWHAMNTWVRDIIPMAGGAYRQLINEFYKENRLMEGTLKLRGEPVLLSNLKANVLNVIAEKDHITPPCQSEGVMAKIGSPDKEVFRVHGGHIGIMAGSGAERTTWPHIQQWLAARAD
jgi:polyhydroxyalkanoate synthase